MAVSMPARASRPLQSVGEDASEHELPAPDGAAQRMRPAPLLAVCGLCGGAGASTLSYFLARFAVDELGGHVLVCDTGGPTGGLAACSGIESARSLSDAAEEIAHGRSLAGGLYEVDARAGGESHELRVVASGPRFDDGGDVRGLPTLLKLARGCGTHALVVVDCGTLQRAADRVALRAASHVAWVLPATRGGVRRAEAVLAAMPNEAVGRELIVARREPHEGSATLKSLKALAEQRRATLVLLPYVGDLLEDAGRTLCESQVSLHAITGVLQR
jgi:hypothetical protein